LSFRSTSEIIQAAQKVISLSSDASGADKLRQKMIPQRAGGMSPRIVAFESGEDEGKHQYLIEISLIFTRLKAAPPIWQRISS
jgi:hypothetical protein